MDAGSSSGIGIHHFILREPLLRGFAPKVRFAPDSPLEQEGFEPSVPLVSRGADRKRFPQLEGMTGDVPGRSSYAVAAPFCELDPTIRGQVLGILRRHLDGAI